MNDLAEPAPVSAKDKRARLAERLRQAAGRDSRHPLSFAQQRLWFLDQLVPNSPLYNVPLAARLTGPLDVSALESALQKIVSRHDSLRTRFESSGETPEQVVSPRVEIKLQVVDASNSGDAESWIREEVRRPFNLTSGEALLRAAVVRVNSKEHLLVLNMHHIVADEWSLKILFRELEEFYKAAAQGGEATVPALPIQYADYADWQREWVNGEPLKQQLAYWKAQLKGKPPVTELMTDRPRQGAAGFEGRTLNRRLRGDLGPRLKELAAGKEATLFMVVLAAFKTLVHRYTALEDVTIGTPVAGRNRVETEGLIGFFVNTLLLRSNLVGDPAFDELLRRVRATALGAYENQDLPFEKLVEALKPDRALGHLTFTNIMFALQNPTAPLALPGLKVEGVDIDTGTSKFDMTFVVKDFGDELVARVEYNSDLFAAATMERLLEHFENLLRAIASNPSQRLSELPMLGEKERHQLLVEWNANSSDYPRHLCIQQLFEARVRETPDAVAVVFAGESMTYAELNTRANRLAHSLLDQNVKPGTPVALCMEPSSMMVAGLLAILKAGGAYVPLDPRYPSERLSFMLKDAGASILLTQKSLLPRLPRCGQKIICLDAGDKWNKGNSTENPANRTTPEDLAYIIYTSGSTGEPKGVAVPHRGITRLVLNTNYIKLDATDRIAQVSNISFDAATFEIWGALLNGGQLRGITPCVALSPADLARELREQRITAMFLTSGLFSQLASEAPGAFATMRTLIAGGEALDPKWVRTVLADRPPLRLVNGYGPTENTTFTCCQTITGVPEGAASVPIGRPISNTQVYILDAHRQPVPVGVPGELYTGGDGLARGYWNRAELTSQKFVSHQFSPNGPRQVLYRTGDLARYLPDGNIEFLGRIDNQVKVRGFRVELGEIEAVLSRHPGVRDCAVKAWGSGAGQARLAAYFVAAAKRAPKPSELRSFLTEQLPDYMTPAAFVQLEALPLTPNGKVDRQALPEPDRGRSCLEKKYASPQDAVELELAGIWEDLLGIAPIGIEDNFFELGGHSLLAVRIAARIEKALGRKLPVAAIFTAPTIEKLAAVIRSKTPAGSITAGTTVVELQPKGTRPPLFLVHGAGGGMFWGYVNLARQLGADQPVFGFSSRGSDGKAEPGTIEELAAQYVKDLRRVQPRGPYFLGGYCFGGNVAYEMARQLESQGEGIALLALLNCAPPNSRYMRVQWSLPWCGRFLRNLSYWLGYCRQWTPSQRRDFARWKWTRLKCWLSRPLAALRADARSVETGSLIDLSSIPEDQRALWQTHVGALVNFHPQPYGGRVDLIRSPGHPLWCSFERDYGWGELTRKGAVVRIVNGAHEKILEEPWVEETAAALKQAIEESREPDLAFWKRELEGAPVGLDLATDRPRAAARSNATGAETWPLPKTLLSQMEGLDPSILILAALNIVLHRYTGQEDLLVGMQIKAGEHPANVVVLRTNLAGELCGREVLDRVRANRMAALQHGELPFAGIFSKLDGESAASPHPNIQVFFTRGIQPAPESFDLRVCLLDNETGLSITVEYTPDLFDAETIQRMLGHLEMAIKGIIETPERLVSELPIVTRAEEERLLVEWNRTERDYPREKTLIDLFDEQVALAPHAEALVCGTMRFTYLELSEHATGVAKRLGALGVGNEALVGICLERSEEMVAGILGTLRAGAAYVPLDPAYPRERLEFIARDAGLRVVLTEKKTRDILSTTSAAFLSIEDCNHDNDPSPPRGVAHPENLAYVLYTSGSTGRPKGVAIEHRNAVAFVSWAREVFSPDEISGVLAATSICFDLSVFELFVPLCLGGKVILADNALGLPGLPAASEVTLVNTVPSAIRELLRVNGVPASVRVVNLAGEPLSTALVDLIYAQTSASKVYDLYGPTETTTYSTFGLRQAGAPPTIGRPLANEQVYILDKHLRPVPVGVQGDLYIAGAGLARGYLNHSELTAERFLSHPFQPGARLYKTGDVARWRNDGNLVYLGRSDHQVKIRGFRIELGEIETAIRSHAGVADAVVIAREDRPGEKRLAAYVVTRETIQMTADEVRRAARAKLPEYMVPACIMFLPSLPMTPNGKVDRRALPAPQEEQRDAGAGFVAPRTDLEKQIAAIWREVLGVNQVGATDSFFELGGDSLSAIQVISRLRTSLKVELPLGVLFNTLTVEALGKGLEARRWSDVGTTVPSLERISREGILPASFMQEQFWFLQQLEPEGDAYNVPVAIRLKGRLNMAALQESLDRILQRHEALRTTFCLSDGGLRQNVAPSLAVKIEVTDLPPGNEERLLEFLRAEARRPFDLERGPLIRARVARMGELEHALAIVMHHAVSDGWSLDILFKELEANYQALESGRPAPEFPPLPVQQADFSHWRRRCMQGDVLEKELAYWRGKLAGAPKMTTFPADAIISNHAAGKVGRHAIDLPETVCKEIGRLSQSEASTPFIVLMTALAVTLQKWTGQTDMVLGTVSAGRNRQEIEGLIGCFVNFLPLRLKIDGSQTGLDVLRVVKGEVIEGQAHQDCPFEKIVESVTVERRPGGNPLYNIALVFQNCPRVPQFGGGMDCAPIALHPDTPLLDLHFEANESPAGIEVACEFKAGMFRPAAIDHLLASFDGVLETLIRSPGARIADFALKVGAPQRQTQTIAICGTFTTEPLEEPLRFWLDELGVSGQIKFAPFQQVFQQLLDPSSVLAANRDGLNVVLARLDDWESLAPIPQAGGASTFGQSAKHNIDELVRAIQTASGRRGAPILICFCPPAPSVAADASKSQTLAELEKAAASALEAIHGVYVVATAELSARYPVADYADPLGDELGHIPYTPVFFTGLATMIARKLHALQRPAFKVIAVDCDQTLWSGVCGEDGPGGVRIDSPRDALQQFLLCEREAGKLLVICSKNEEADVNAVFSHGPPMPLKREHFSAARVNWGAKSENLKSMARELKLGLGSFIFIDDNPVECAEVEANCPEVLTLQLPDDPAAIPQFLDHCWAFDQLKATKEDSVRAESYRQERQREELQAKGMSFADFIAELGLEVQITPAVQAQLSRVAQLTLRTNQFNASGRRRTENEIKHLGSRYEVLTVSVKDRFGDYGLVGVMIFETVDKAIVVDSLLLSCRALGRGVEHQMLASLGQIARQRGAQWVDVPVERLPRNQPVLDFLESLGPSFRQSGENSLRFHFPADIAAGIIFNPNRADAAPAKETGSNAPTPARVPRTFAKYRAIALESDDAVKIHHRMEARSGLRPACKAAYAPPRNQMERQLCELWQKVLRVERIGIDDDFFDLGGHSLLAVRLFAQVEKMSGRKLPLVTLFQAPTIGQLASVLCQEPTSGLNAALVPIQPHGSKPALYLVHGAGGDVLWGYANLVPYMDPDRPIYALKSRGQTGLPEFERIEDMAEHYVQVLRANQPEGPYYLGGYCFGGNVACEMARQLEASGSKVAFLALLDAAPTNAGYETAEWWRPQFVGLFARNLCYWLQDFRGVKPADRRRFIARKFRTFGRKLARRARGVQSEPAVDLEEVIDPAQFSEHELKLWDVHLRALANYSQRPYSGHVSLFRTRGHPLLSSYAADLRWGGLATGGVTVRLIPGSHESIFMEPNVKFLAGELTAALSENDQIPSENKTTAVPL